MADSSGVAKVFISHSGADNVTAYAVKDQLDRNGYETFLDFEIGSIAGGADWERAIFSALSESIALVLCVTPESIASPWVWAEVILARYLGIPVIPLRVKGPKVPDLLKQTTQVIDLRTDPGRGYEKLLSSLKKHREMDPTRRVRMHGAPAHPKKPEGQPLSLRVVAGLGRTDGASRGQSALSVPLVDAYGLAVGPDGSLYVGNKNGVGICRIDKDGVGAQVADGVVTPGQIVIDDDDLDPARTALYATSIHRHVIHRVLLATGTVEIVAGSGSEGHAGDGGRPSDASFYRPSGIAVTPGGANIYVADTLNHCIRRIDVRGGKVENIAGNGTQGYSGDHGPGTRAQLNAPTFLQWINDDFPWGSLLISDRENHCIRKLRLRDGEITTIVGTGQAGFSEDGTSATECSLSGPAGLAMTPRGLCFAEATNHRIRLLRSDGTVVTIAGTGANGFSGDVRDARQAELWLPSGLCWDPARGLYVADFAHRQIKLLEGPFWN